MKKKRAKKLIYLAAFMLLMVPLVAFGQSNSAISTEMQKATMSLLGLANHVQDFLHSMLWWVLLTIGSLLQNDILYGGAVEDRLLQLWGYVRDVVNVFFVLVLVGIAFYNVVRGPGESYEIKTILPKFVLALIAVNFSYLGVKLVLDGVNIVATGIFALPNTVQESLELDKDGGKKICEGFFGEDEAQYKANIEKASEGGKIVMCTKDKQLDITNPAIKTYFDGYNSRNAALALALNLQKIDMLKKVKVPTGQEGFNQLTLNILFSITLYVIFAASFIALMVVLLVRLIVLWLMIVLSPLIALKSVLPESLQSSLGGGEDIGKQFLKHAIVPIPVALVMSIGFIMLTAFERTKFADTTLSLETLNINILTSGITTLQQLIAALGTVAFIWKGVFESMKDTYASSIVETIKGSVEGAAKTLGKLPTMMPLFPIADGKMVTTSDLMMLPRAVDSKIERAKEQSFEDKFGKPMGLTRGADQIGQEIGASRNFNQVKSILAKSYDERRSKEWQQGLAKYFKEHDFDLKPGMLPDGMPKNKFLEQLEAGTLDDTKIKQFYEKSGITIEEKTKPKPGEAAAAGAGAAVALSDEELAKKHSMSGDEFSALVNRADLQNRTDLTADESKKLDELGKALTDKNEKEIDNLVKDPTIKAAMQKLVTADKANSDFTHEILKVRDKNTPKPEDKVTALNAEFMKEYKNLTGKDTFDASKLDEKDKKAIAALQKVKSKFSDTQKKDLKNAGNYTGTLLETVLSGSQAAPPAGPKPAGPKPGTPPGKPAP